VAELNYGPAARNFVLREAICTHLRRSRAVVCDPSDIIIVNGSQQALDLIARVLLEPGDRVATENPHKDLQIASSWLPSAVARCLGAVRRGMYRTSISTSAISTNPVRTARVISMRTGAGAADTGR